MLSTRPLPKELQQVAIQELNENPDKIHEHVMCVREWVQTQEHLKVKTDDQNLVNILRGCKYDLEEAKQKIDMMCTMRTDLPEFFTKRDPFLPEMQELLELGICLPLRKTIHPGSPRVILSRYPKVDPSRLKPADGLKFLIMLGDIMLNEDDNLIIGGTYTIADFRGSSLEHTKLIDLRLIRAAYKLYNEAYTVTPRGSYSINVPRFAEMLYNNMFKYLIRPDHRELMHIYSESDPKDLHDTIPLSILPPEYGGDGDSIQELTAYWKDKMESYREWFIEEEQYRVDHSKRPKNTSLGWLGTRFSFT